MRDAGRWALGASRGPVVFVRWGRQPIVTAGFLCWAWVVPGQEPAPFRRRAYECARVRTACAPQVGLSRFAVALCGPVGHHCRQRSWSPPSQCACVCRSLVAPGVLPGDSSPATRLHSTPTTRRAIAPLLRVPSRPCLAQLPRHHGTMTPLRCYVPSTTWLRGPRSPSWPGIVFGPF